MTATPAHFVASLTHRPAEFLDRFRDVHLDKNNGAPKLTLAAPRNPEGFWQRLTSLGPVGMVRASYRASREARAETVDTFKAQLASHFGKAIADRVASRLTDRTTLSLHQVRNIARSAGTLKTLETLNLKKIAAAVNSQLQNAPGADASLPQITGEQLRHLGWSDAQRQQLVVAELTIAELLAWVSAVHEKHVPSAGEFATRPAQTS